MAKVVSDMDEFVRKLRTLMTTYDRLGYVLDAALPQPVLEAEAVGTRASVRAAADAVEKLLRLIEQRGNT